MTRPAGSERTIIARPGGAYARKAGPAETVASYVLGILLLMMALGAFALWYGAGRDGVLYEGEMVGVSPALVDAEGRREPPELLYVYATDEHQLSARLPIGPLDQRVMRWLPTRVVNGLQTTGFYAFPDLLALLPPDEANDTEQASGGPPTDAAARAIERLPEHWPNRLPLLLSNPEEAPEQHRILRGPEPRSLLSLLLFVGATAATLAYWGWGRERLVRKPVTLDQVGPPGD